MEHTAHYRAQPRTTQPQRPSLDPNPHVRRLFDCSTGHLSDDTKAKMTHVLSAVYPTEYGWLAHVPEDLQVEGMTDRPADLLAVFEMAKAACCEYVLFDADGPEVPGLAWYDGERDEQDSGVRCRACDWNGLLSDGDPPDGDWYAGLEPGDVVPACLCPECGDFCDLAAADRPLTERENATILAALRHWQHRDRDRNLIVFMDIATNGGNYEMLTSKEIDDIARRFGGTP